MAAINDLIAQIKDSELRARIEAELDRMNKQKKFGLVFEEHLPESVKLYDVPVKKNSIEKKKAVAKGKALFYFGIVVWLAVSVGLLIAGNKTDSFIGGGLLLLLGFLLLVWPIIWFIDKGKRE